MWELTKRITLRISSVLSMVKPEPDLCTGSSSDQKVPAPTGSGSATLPARSVTSRYYIQIIQYRYEYIIQYMLDIQVRYRYYFIHDT